MNECTFTYRVGQYKREESATHGRDLLSLDRQQTICDRLKDVEYDNDMVPDYQRIAISGEDVSGVSAPCNCMTAAPRTFLR